MWNQLVEYVVSQGYFGSQACFDATSAYIAYRSDAERDVWAVVVALGQAVLQACF